VRGPYLRLEASEGREGRGDDLLENKEGARELSSLATAIIPSQLLCELRSHPYLFRERITEASSQLSRSNPSTPLSLPADAYCELDSSSLIMTSELTEQIHGAWRDSFQVLNRDMPGIRGLLDVSKVSG